MVLPDTIDISDDRLAAIKAKVEAYDWSQLPDAGGWTSGVGVNDLKRLVAYWRPQALLRILGARGVAAVHRLPTAAALAYGPRTSRPGRVAATRTPCGGEAGRGRSPAIRDGLLWMSSW
jgi:hypothetical protein